MQYQENKHDAVVSNSPFCLILKWNNETNAGKEKMYARMDEYNVVYMSTSKYVIKEVHKCQQLS